MNIINTSIELGLLYAPFIIGVFLTFRILNFPDLTVESSFVLGAAVTSIAIENGVPGMLALLLGFLAGLMGGCLTAFLHNRLGIGKVLSGILSLGMLYTINLRVMGGPNVSLLNEQRVITIFSAPINNTLVILFLLLIVTIVKILIDWFLTTELGMQLRATGDNEVVAKSFAVDTKMTKFLGISLSNGLVGLSGSLIAQFQGFSDISMGMGTVVMALAALMLGETILVNNKISTTTFAIIIGSVAYQLILSVCLQLGLAGTDLKFITAVIVILALIVGNRKGVVSNYAKKLFSN